MIKFFRRIRQRLLSENKVSKYLVYAVGEIVLVVIGILIALQVSNWNERAKIEESKEEHLLILQQNLKEDLEQLEVLATTMNAHVNYADSAMRQIRTEIPMDRMLKKYLTLLIREYEFRPNRNAIETLTQYNEIPYLGEDLQTAIMDYYALIESAGERESISNEHIQLRYEPYIMEDYPIVFQRDNPWETFQELYKNDPRPTQPIDEQQFLQDRTLEGLLFSRYYQATQLSDFYMQLKDSAVNLIELIDKSLTE